MLAPRALNAAHREMALRCVDRKPSAPVWRHRLGIDRGRVRGRPRLPLANPPL